MSQAGSNSSSGGGGGGSGIMEVVLNTGTVSPNGSGQIALRGEGAGSSVVFYQDWFGRNASEIDLLVTDDNDNTFLGQNNGSSSLSSSTSVGSSALAQGNGTSNNAIGAFCLNNLSNGSQNNAMGNSVLNALTSGSLNVAIGDASGALYSSSESSNILLNSSGTLGDSNTLRIGAGTGTGNQQLNAAFIHGIFGITIGVSGIPLSIDNTGKLGTAVSSAKFKENIQEIGSEISAKLHDLKPVTFNYIADETKSLVYGLIAEEVEKIFPEMVSKDADGNIVSVKYQDLPVLLLNELIKLKKELDTLKTKE